MRNTHLTRFVCAVDFSEFSRQALDRAVALARWYSAELRVLHVTSAPKVIGAGLSQLVGPIRGSGGREQLRARLRALVAQARPGGLRVGAAIREGDPAAEILRYASAMSAHLIVIGSSDSSGSRRIVPGSVVNSVAGNARCPTLTIPAHVKKMPGPGAPPFQQILYAVDFSTLWVDGLEYALSLAEDVQGRVMLLPVLADDPKRPFTPHRGVGKLRRQFGEDVTQTLWAAVPAAARSWCDIHEGAVSSRGRQIVDIADDIDADLIVMGTEGWSPSERMLSSTNYQVMRDARCPVLVAQSLARYARARVSGTASHTRATTVA